MCGECCTRYTITVTHLDAYRIAGFTGLNPGRFLTLVRPDESVADTYFDTPKIGLGDQDDYVLALKENGRACMFRKGCKCSIYSARPLVCRPFPFRYSLKGKNDFEFSVNGEARGFCKGLGIGSEKFDFAELSKVVRVMETERGRFDKQIQKWNAKVTKGRIDKPSVIDLIRFLLPSIKR
jgi:Fe-S-cluster containining protein